MVARVVAQAAPIVLQQVRMERLAAVEVVGGGQARLIRPLAQTAARVELVPSLTAPTGPAAGPDALALALDRQPVTPRSMAVEEAVVQITAIPAGLAAKG